MLSEGKIKISELKPHPQNNFYFDDMEGDAWDSLLQSISTSNVTNAITITVILSFFLANSDSRLSNWLKKTIK